MSLRDSDRGRVPRSLRWQLLLQAWSQHRTPWQVERMSALSSAYPRASARSVPFRAGPHSRCSSPEEQFERGRMLAGQDGASRPIRAGSRSEGEPRARSALALTRRTRTSVQRRRATTPRLVVRLLSGSGAPGRGRPTVRRRRMACREVAGAGLPCGSLRGAPAQHDDGEGPSVLSQWCARRHPPSPGGSCGRRHWNARRRP
jgi:hypothetical protein